MVNFSQVLDGLTWRQSAHLNIVVALHSEIAIQHPSSPVPPAHAITCMQLPQKGKNGEKDVAGSGESEGLDGLFADMRANNTSEADLMSLFEAGKDASRRGGVDQVRRRANVGVH